ncbi:hypothetical protein ABNavy1_118 [Acinetobacter phage AB-Navy1]|nr:hypothetical protein ABNavy1_118 [Acinetobacter phage AB-Navy1]
MANIAAPTHILKIEGDENDADMINIEHRINPEFPNRIFEPNEVFKGSRAVNFMELINALASSLHLPRKTTHTWTRSEFDDVSAAIETSTWVFITLFGIDPNGHEFIEKHGDEKAYEAILQVKEALDDNLPFGEFGIHTIDSITMRPITSEETLYSNPGYWENQKIKKQLERATVAVHFMDEEDSSKDQVAVYDTTQKPFKMWNPEKHKWEDNGYEYRSQFAQYGGKIVKEFK